MKSDVNIELDSIIKDLTRKEKALDKILSMNRETIRLCAKGIKLVHQGKMKDAKPLITKISSKLKVIRSHGIEFQNYYHQVEQEYAEFVIFYNLVLGKQPPDYKKMKITYTSYLTGLMDCIGELRRYMLDSIRRKDIKTAEHMFNLMEELYNATLPLHFSRALLPNFKQKQDVSRRQVEFARSELTYAMVSMQNK
ncbi:hypothetical protein J7J90_02405 [Candidatus Micrarchaeota archaeon]|nr:hypothetical protein [Candidatus Micrarchaeota archaeon]